MALSLNPKPKRMIIQGLDDEPNELHQSTIFRAEDFTQTRGDQDDPMRHSITMPLSREPEKKR